MRRVWDAHLVMALIVSIHAVAYAQSPGPSRKLAFLVGVNEYDHGQLANLKFGENDVTDLNEVLKAQGYQTRLLTSATSKNSPELTPTSSNIRSQLEAFLKGATKRDLVIVGFAGHGLQLTGHSQSYFCPQDANPASQGGELLQPDTLVSVEEILETLDNSGVGQKIVLIDACRNDPSVRGKRSARGVTEVRFDSLPPRTAVLLSCKAGQFAFEHENLGNGRGHGLFFHRVIEGLKQHASDKEGRVTWEDLSKYVRLEVPGDVKRLFGKDGGEQNPNVLTNLEDVSVLARIELNELNNNKSSLRDRLPETLPGKPSVSGSPVSELRLRQADTFLRQADYENAIAAYASIVEDNDLELAVRKEARKGRGAAYIARGRKSDIGKALIDQTTAGLPGIRLTIRSATSELKIEAEIKARLTQNQTVLVTRAEGNWLWVAAVDGNEKLNGYIKIDSVSLPDSDSQPNGIAAASLANVNPSTAVLSDPLLRQADTYLRQADTYLRQADTYLRQADHENAITAYSAIIENTGLPLDVRQEARKGRGAAYLVRGTKSDINKALIDQRAAGLPGIQLSIRAASADMKVVNDVTGKLRQNQSVLVSHIQGDWLWVTAVDGSDKLKGYISIDAVITPPAQPQQQVNALTAQQYQEQLQWYQQNQQQNQRRSEGPKSIWETPEWETPAQIREGRRNGTLK